MSPGHGEDLLVRPEDSLATHHCHLEREKWDMSRIWGTPVYFSPFHTEGITKVVLNATEEVTP